MNVLTAQNGSFVSGGSGDGDQHMWESTVTIVGIALCAIIVLVTIALVCHHRIAKKRRQKDKQAVPANQALLVNGEVANSPSHSGNSFQGSTNASYGDPTGAVSPTKRDYVLATKGVSTGVGSPTRDGPQQKAVRVKKSKSPPPRGGREVSNTTQGSTAKTPPSPYTANARHSDFVHEPGMLTAAPLSPDSPTKGHSSHHHHHKSRDKERSRGREKEKDRHGHRQRSPAKSPSGDHQHHHRRSSPTKGASKSRSRSRSPAGLPPTGLDTRRQRDPGAPLAGEEDLSPVSPTTPSHRKLSDLMNGSKMAPITENIQMDSLYANNKNKKARNGCNELSPTDIPGQRPPVEGRDSLSRKKGRQRGESPEHASTTGYQVKLPPSTTDTLPDDDIQNANYHGHKGQRPHVKPLPLRSVQRPDGQSPEHRPYDPNANMPPSAYVSEGLSPDLQDAKLFPENGSRAHTPGSAEFVSVPDDFEYDDYVPQLPGSYFTMDPHAYTLTWSQQAPWAQQQMSGGSRAPSQGSMDNNGSSHC